MAKPDYSAWNLIDEFRPIEAAFLWLDTDPPANCDREPALPVVNAFTRTLKKRFTKQHPNPGWDGNPGTSFITLPRPTITRAELKALADELNAKPPFLFPELQAATPAPAPQEKREANNAETAPERQIRPRKPIKRVRDAWTEVIRATIDAFEAEHGFTPTAREAWTRLVNTYPDGWSYDYRQDRNDCLMAGEKLPLDQATFEQRFRRLFPATRSR